MNRYTAAVVYLAAVTVLAAGAWLACLALGIPLPYGMTP